MEELSVKKREGRSCRENRGAIGSISKQGIYVPVLQLQQPWQSPLGTPTAPEEGGQRRDSLRLWLQKGCGDTGRGRQQQARETGEVLSYWCCFWRASETELHCWKLRVLPSSLFISSRWAFFSASMAAEGEQ